MNCFELNQRLDAYLADAMTPVQRHECEAHFDQCPVCRDAISSLRALRAATAGLPRAMTPSRDLWPEVEGMLVGPVLPDEPGSSVSWRFRRWLVPLAIAACVTITAGIVWLRPSEPSGWTVASLAGAPRVGDKAITGSRTWRVGQWLETDAASRAQFAVGSIGEVQLEANSRLRLLEAAPTDHRIELARGTMHALIWAPPRLFFVETPDATAIDLGCAYTLTIDDHGVGRLEVTSGYVALEHGDRSAVIPAGMLCLTHPRIGPGTPFATDASPQLRSALDQFDAGAGGGAALDAILAHARADDAVTLWHLLTRAPPDQRHAVFDKLAEFAPPPDGITEAGILAGNKSMLDRWGWKLGLLPVAAD